MRRHQRRYAASGAHLSWYAGFYGEGRDSALKHGVVRVFAVTKPDAAGSARWRVVARETVRGKSVHAPEPMEATKL